MFKLAKFAFLTAALVCLLSPTLSAQWVPSQSIGGGRATAVDNNGNSTTRNNDGWRWGPISFNSPLTVNAVLLNKAHGNVDARLLTPAEQRLNTFAITERPFRGYRRARVVGESDGNWTYFGRPGFYTFTLTLYGDIGTNPIRQPYDFFEYPDVTLGTGEAADQGGTVVFTLPNGNVVAGVLAGQDTTWFAPGVDIQLSGIRNSVAEVSIFVEPGDQVNLMMNTNSSLTLRPRFFGGSNFFGPLRSRVLADLEISPTRNDGPPTR